MKQTKLMRALTIKAQKNRLTKSMNSTSRFVSWEQRCDWKLKQAEIAKAESPKNKPKNLLLIGSMISMPYFRLPK
jgi:hypothetical protein